MASVIYYALVALALLATLATALSASDDQLAAAQAQAASSLAYGQSLLNAALD